MNKHERNHLNQVASLGCVACRNTGLGETPAEIHHIREGMGRGQRNCHYKTIPLCPIHHRLKERDPLTGKVIPSIHGDPAGFKAEFGTESELLEQVQSELPQNF